MNNKGFTLIESLFAFSIYVTCIVLFISLINQGLIVRNKIKYISSEKDVIVSKKDTLESVVNQVLH